MFWRDVGKIAFQLANVCAALAALVDLDDTEIQQLDLATHGDHQVLGRNVAVDDAEGQAIVITFCVRVVQCLERLDRGVSNEVGGKFLAHAAGPSRQLSEIASDDVFLNQEVLTADASEIENGNDVRVHQR